MSFRSTSPLWELLLLAGILNQESFFFFFGRSLDRDLGYIFFRLGRRGCALSMKAGLVLEANRGELSLHILRLGLTSECVT